MTDTTTTTVPGKMHQDHEGFTKAVAIVLAMRQVADDLRVEIAAIRQAHPDMINPPGASARQMLVEGLKDARQSLHADVCQVARANGLRTPEGF